MGNIMTAQNTYRFDGKYAPADYPKIIINKKTEKTGESSSEG
jgi:hypothetical protein